LLQTIIYASGTQTTEREREQDAKKDVTVMRTSIEGKRKKRKEKGFPTQSLNRREKKSGPNFVFSVTAAHEERNECIVVR
jgi:hypothetical protein